MHCGIYSLCGSKAMKVITLRQDKYIGLYCYKFLTFYVKWYSTIQKYNVES